MSEERMKFVSRLLNGKAMTHLCREFGISRQTGYKIYNHNKQEGLQVNIDRFRRSRVPCPGRYANQLPEPSEQMMSWLRQDKPNWGALKTRELLIRKLASKGLLSAVSTIHTIMERLDCSNVPNSASETGQKEGRICQTPRSQMTFGALLQRRIQT